MNLSPAEFDLLVERISTSVANKVAASPRLVDRYALAEILGVSVPTIERLQREGTIVPFRIGRRCVYDPDGVMAALYARKGTAPGNSST